MYLKYYGLAKQPFTITPDTDLFFSGNERGAALEALLFTINSGCGITKVIGEVGTGKTLLCRMLANQLPLHVDVVYLANPSLSPEDMLHALAIELGLSLPPQASKLVVIQLLTHTLLDKHTQGRQVVALIEEAQCMSIDSLEEIRLLSNLETNQHKLLQMVLFGQPELDEMLARHEIRQLKERISYSLYLRPFAQKDIHAYLSFRMQQSGYQGHDVFSTRAAKLIAKHSSGLARRINLIADKALMLAFIDGRREINSRDIRLAVQDSEFNGMTVSIRTCLLVILLLSSLSLLLWTTWQASSL
jgi:type II secretory pathway predicted ATPase ExeA